MKDFITGGLWGLAVGMVVGGIVVAKNKKLANTIDESTDRAEQKMQEIKDDLMQKVEEAKQSIDQNKKQKLSQNKSNKN